eukprot:2786075-Pleurochrysis_carterae.AAC.3
MVWIVGSRVDPPSVAAMHCDADCVVIQKYVCSLSPPRDVGYFGKVYKYASSSLFVHTLDVLDASNEVVL